MPILNLQKAYRQVGRIRTGDKSDKGVPHKLESFRLTSASRDVMDAAAVLYGGAVTDWKDAPTPGQYELYTDTDVISVLVPPGQVLSQWNEMWSGGGCKRRCDGVTEQLTDSPCMCPEDVDERHKLAQAGKACHIVTRLSVMIPDLPDFGIWRLESKGFYAAVEIGGTMAILEKATAQGVILPAQLRLEQRSVKRGGQNLKYAVPVLEMPETTTRQLLAGLGMIPEAEPAAPVAALPAPTSFAMPPTAAASTPNLADPATIAAGPQRQAAPPRPAPSAPPSPKQPLSIDQAEQNLVKQTRVRDEARAVAAQLRWTTEQGKAWVAAHPELTTNADRLTALKVLLEAQEAAATLGLTPPPDEDLNLPFV